MRARFTPLLALLALCLAGCAPVTPPDAGPAQGATVVLLHGLARSASSMDRMAASLRGAGYHVCNIDYPSREHTIAVLAAEHVAPQVAACRAEATAPGPVHFVTHSLGGIIVRQLAATGAVQGIGRVAMLGPPNQGSEVVDVLGGWALFRKINGPAGDGLGTGPGSVPQTLGPARFELGVIAGTRSINWILSTYIPGTDDGKVSVQRAQLQGMRDFVTVAASHPFLMRDREAIAQTLRFLAQGCFANGRQACGAAGGGR